MYNLIVEKNKLAFQAVKMIEYFLLSSTLTKLKDKLMLVY